MQCPCGGSTVDHEHEIKTLKGIREWFPHFPEENVHELPILIKRKVCEACGRQLMFTKILF